jgi:protein phosphatase
MLHTLPQPDRSPSASQTATPLPLEVWGATDKGRQREGNEDSIYPHSAAESTAFKPNAERLAQKGQLLLVADGVGGARAGAEASQWAVRVAVERYYDLPSSDLSADLQAAIEVANVSLYQYLQSTGTQEAGCTMAAAVVHRNMLYVANVGDSRVYVIRKGQIAQQTRDHTLTQQKVDHQIIGAEDAKNDPDQHVLVRSLGAAETVRVDVFPPLQLFDGDVALVCSDGLTDMLEDAEIVRTLGNGPVKRAAQRLIDAANKRGGVDNISVVLARVGQRTSGGGGLLEGLRGLVDSIRGMALWQKLFLLAGGALVVVAFCVMLALGWWMYDRGRGKATPTPTPLSTEEATTAPVETRAPTDTSQPTPTERGPVPPTSTPLPTFTPSPTPIPDRDGDGVFDFRDECPEVYGTHPNGCPDRDGDGSDDRYDKCPDQPGLPEMEGCPDSDGDGLHDEIDQCPNEPGPLENGGCPKESPKPTSKPSEDPTKVPPTTAP